MKRNEFIIKLQNMIYQMGKWASIIEEYGCGCFHISASYSSTYKPIEYDFISDFSEYSDVLICLIVLRMMEYYHKVYYEEEYYEFD